MSTKVDMNYIVPPNTPTLSRHDRDCQFMFDEQIPNITRTNEIISQIRNQIDIYWKEYNKLRT